MDWIDEIENRLNAAVKGPWKACGTEPRPSVSYGLGGTIKSSRHQHGACSCGFVWSEATDSPVLEIIGGAWGDRWPAIRSLEDGTLEAFQDSCVYSEVPREQQAATMKLIEKVPEDIARLIAEIRRLRT